MAVTRLNDRFVAFLDILGFSDQLARIPLETLHDRYAALIDDADQTLFQPPNLSAPDGPRHRNFDYAGFHSDSVILVSKPLDTNGPESAFNFTAACTQLLEKGFARSLPYRGCIGIGDVLLDEDRRLFLSNAIPRLLNIEKRQEWCGCVIDRAVEARLLGLLYGGEPNPSQGWLVMRYPVPEKQARRSFVSKLLSPLKRRRPGDGPGLCLNWVTFLSPRELDAGLAFLIEPKLGHTRRFVEAVGRLTILHFPFSVRGSAIVAVRLQMARSGMRMKFMDAAGEGVDLPEGSTVDIRVGIGPTIKTSGENE